MRKAKNIIETRRFTGSSIPVGSKLGSILINSSDSKNVASAIRASIKGNVNVIHLSEKTIENIKTAEQKSSSKPTDTKVF